jgi:tetratricopeptide (TPR) repeat protein
MKRMISRIATILMITAALLQAQSADAAPANSVTDSLFARGNDYYMQRQYAMAEQCYSRILALGYESGELYFNLGNAFYKQDKYAPAILYYEKALLLKPGDEDIRQNLTLANARIIDKIDVIPDFFIKRWILAIRGLFSPDQWAVISVVLFAASLLAFVIYFAGRRMGLRKAGLTLGLGLLSLSILSLMLMFSRVNNIREHDNAIIMSPSVNARSSPDEQSTNVFVLHEGTKVMVTDSVQNWKEIRLANGSTGWVQEEVLEDI